MGDLRIVAIPGECLHLGERIVRSSPDPVLVFGYANGYVGYLVDEAADAASTCKKRSPALRSWRRRRTGEWRWRGHPERARFEAEL
ncbi:MAG: hypothetical protein R2855_13445 [Thermomicrobiales bacterium]